jgi:hypothetical protein
MQLLGLLQEAGLVLLVAPGARLEVGQADLRLRAGVGRKLVLVDATG